MRVQAVAGKTSRGTSFPGDAFVCSARRLGRVALVLAIFIPPLVVLAPFLSDEATLAQTARLGTWLATLAWTPEQRALVAFVELLPAGALVVALRALCHVCREYVVGALFSEPVLHAFRRVGLALVAAAVLQFLQPTLLSLLLSLTLPAGARQVTVGVHSGDLLLGFLSAVVLLLVQVMRVAQQVQAENAEIV